MMILDSGLLFWPPCIYTVGLRFGRLLCDRCDLVMWWLVSDRWASFDDFGNLYLTPTLDHSQRSARPVTHKPLSTAKCDTSNPVVSSHSLCSCLPPTCTRCPPKM